MFEKRSSFDTSFVSPPFGCLQYFTSSSGRIKTFNYDSDEDNHLNDQR